MAQRPFKLPDIGEGTAEAELVAWHVAVGDDVVEDQPLCDVMTDKATVEVTAPFAGRVVERTGNPGELLPVGSVILMFDSGDADASPETPVSREEAPSAAAAAATEAPSQRKRVLTTPAVRKRASDAGIALHDVQGTGPHGRIRQADIDLFLARTSAAIKPESRGPSPAKPDSASPSPALEGGDEFDEIPVIGLRRRIAERMQDTKRRIPHFSYIEEVDVTSVEALRSSLNAERGDGRPKLTLLPFLIQALTRVLPEFPNLNALYDDMGGTVRQYKAVHMGIATQTPSGLVVTVVRDAGQRDVWNLASEVARLSEAARTNRAAATELNGSTITITSLGAVGGLATTPVINSPEVAILGINKIAERPIVRDGHIVVAKMMNLSASFDHRVVDGWDAALFVQRLKTFLETPARLFIDR